MKSRLVRFLLRIQGAHPRSKAIWRQSDSSFHAKFIFFMGDQNTPFEQRLLDSACNRHKLQRQSLAKALRLGARFDAVCSTDSTPAFSFYGRHGTRAYEADYLLSLGADPSALDAKGRNFAHYAVKSMNKAMVSWALRTRPDIFQVQDKAGHTPFDLILGEFIGGWTPPEDRDAFRDWLIERADPSARERVALHGFKTFCSLLGSRTYDDVESDCAWLVRIGASLISSSEAALVLEPLDSSANGDAISAGLAVLAPIFSQADRALISAELPLVEPRLSFGKRRTL